MLGEDENPPKPEAELVEPSENAGGLYEIELLKYPVLGPVTRPKEDPVGSELVV